MTKILVTGAGGFVGRQICDALKQSGQDVIALLRTGDDQAKAIPSRTTDDLFSETDANLQKLLDDVHTVVHSAWYAEPGKYETSLKNLDCLAGTVRLAKAATEVGVQRFVGLGTCVEYDFQWAEQQNAFPLEPDAKLGPTSVYGSAKVAAYYALSRAFIEAGISFVWCRLFFLFGAGEDDRRLLPYVLNRVSEDKTVDLTEGHQVRDFLDVSEAGRMIADVATGDGIGPFNICSGRATTVRDFILSQVPEEADRELLRFGARDMRPGEPPCIVGLPGGLDRPSSEGEA